MVDVKDITKSYGQLKILKGVNLFVERGEIVSIVGASGAGKSTLLHILGTLESPDSGSLHINGVDVFRLPPRKLAQFRNQQIGFVFQFHHLLPEFTALENVCMPAWIGGQEKQKAIKRAMELLEHMGMQDRIDHKPAELSGGEQQRLSIARALMNQPAIVLADEPTGNLDSQNAAVIYSMINSLRNEFKQTFILVTHNEELAVMSDTMLRMVDGTIIS